MINIQNIDDNECFKWCLVRYIHHADRNPVKITKVDRDFATRLDFKGTKYSVKTRDIYRIEKKNSISISAFGHEDKKYPIYVSKKCYEENTFISY